MFTPQHSAIEAAFRHKFPQSGRLYDLGKQVFPSGVTHDGRYLEPFPVYVTEARGSRCLRSKAA